MRRRLQEQTPAAGDKGAQWAAEASRVPARAVGAKAGAMADDLKEMAAQGGDMKVFADMTARAMQEDLAFDYYAVEESPAAESADAEEGEMVVPLEELGRAIVLVDEDSELVWAFEGDGGDGGADEWSSDDENAEGNPDFDYPDEESSTQQSEDYDGDYGYETSYFR